MLRMLAQLALNGFAVWLAAEFVPGVTYSGGLLYLLVVGLVIGLINLLVKPLVTLLSLPLIVVTLGAFFLVINALMFYLAGVVLPGLEIAGCLPAFLGGLVIAAFNWIVRAFGK